MLKKVLIIFKKKSSHQTSIQGSTSLKTKKKTITII
jgi:hypothetical protein